MSLKETRKKRELSQSQLSKISGISTRTLQNYEQGTRDINKAEALIVYKLCKALDCSFEDILDISKE